MNGHRRRAAVLVPASFTLALLLAANSPLAAQNGVVALLVIDDATDAAIPSVRVSIVGEPRERVTDDSGHLIYVVSRPGRVELIIRRLGYIPGAMMVDVTVHDTALVTFALTPATQTLATVTIRDTIASTSPFLRGFEHRVRAHAGSATYITRSDIERLHPLQVTDLLRRVSSVTVTGGTVVARRIQRPVIKGSGTSMFLDLANCPLRVAVDGELKEPGYSLNMVAPEEIHGIEVYPGPSTVPAEYATTGPNGACGVIVIWTRRDK